MKQIIFIISTFIFLQATNIVAQENKADSIIVEYQIYENDTLITRDYQTIFARGLKQYIDDSPVDYKNAHYDLIVCETTEYLKRNAIRIRREILEGYGKERCKEMLDILSNIDKSYFYFVRMRIDIKGVIKCVEFMYIPQLSPFMTYEDIKRNTEIIINSKPDPCLVEYGIELSPWICFTIRKGNIQEFLKSK